MAVLPTLPDPIRSDTVTLSRLCTLLGLYLLWRHANPTANHRAYRNELLTKQI